MNQKQKDRYKIIIKYIVSHYQVGKTHLYKILFFVDQYIFSKTGKTLTGDTYIKDFFGPTGKHVKEILDELETERCIKILKEQMISYSKSNIVLLENYDEIDFNTLEVKETDIIRRFCDLCDNQTADKLSEKTHTSVWHSLEMKEDISNFLLPYYFDKEVSDEGKEEALKIAST